ncbi:MAG: hypothetical protein ABI598_05495 [Chloroflexota bacterium]
MVDSPHIVEDITFEGPDGDPVEAWLVRPARLVRTGTPPVSPGPGILAWHWLEPKAPDGNRTQFLEEAGEWAALGITSLLPQGRFPWHQAPTGAVADRAGVRAEVGRLRAGLDRLATEPGVDPSRLGVVGHDFGGMLAAVAAADDDRLRALVIIAATPRWGDWFLPFWPIPDDRIDYLRTLRPLDPIECINRVRSPEILLQFGRRDFYIAEMSGREFQRAAPDGASGLMYDTGHDMRLPEIRADRVAFLARVLNPDDMSG